MRFSSRRSKVSILVSLLALAGIVGAFAATAVISKSSSSAAHAAASTSSYSGVMAHAQMAGSVNPTTLPKSGPSAPNHVVAPYHSQPRSTNSSTNTAVHSSVVPSVTSSGSATGKVLHAFQGVSGVDNSNATGGYDLEPPDEGLAASNGYAANFVNLTGTIYNANGSIAAGPFPLALQGGGGFFNEDLANIVSDPRAYYDAKSHLWIALIWVTLADNSASHVDIAINAGNPTTPWTIYRFDVTDPTAAGCPCLPDFTILGTDQYNIYFVPNEFQLFGAMGFNGSIIYAVAKSDLISGVATPNVAKFSNLSIDGAVAYHLQPAATYGSANAEYFANAIDPSLGVGNGAFGSSIGVWALTNRNKISSGVLPTLSSTVVKTQTFITPVNAQTPVGFSAGVAALGKSGTTAGLLNPDDDALQNLQYINGHLYTTLDTAVNVAGDTAIRDGVDWFDITPSLSGNVISSKTSLYAQGSFAKQSLYLLYPHIEHAASGVTAIVFSFTGPQTYPSAAYVVRSAGAKNFGGVRVVAAGAAPDNGFTGTAAFGGLTRWGDYSAGQLDASGNGIWFATQYIAGNGDQFVNWSNYIFEIAS